MNRNFSISAIVALFCFFTSCKEKINIEINKNKIILNLEGKPIPKKMCYNFHNMNFEPCDDTTILRLFKKFKVIDQKENYLLIKNDSIIKYAYEFKYSDSSSPRKLNLNIIDEYGESGDLHYFIVDNNIYHIPHETYFNLFVFKLDSYLNPKVLLVFTRGSSGESFELSNYILINHQSGISTNYILKTENTFHDDPNYFMNYDIIEKYYADSSVYLQNYDSIQVFHSKIISKYWLGFTDHEYTDSIKTHFRYNEFEE